MEGISGEINRYSPVDQSGSRDAETENLLALWQSDRPGQVRISKPCQLSPHIVCNSSRGARVARQTSTLDLDAGQAERSAVQPRLSPVTICRIER